MCLELRNTESRGRSGVPTILLRTWCRRRNWRTFLAFCWSMTHSGLAAAREGLAFLAPDLLILVTDALALVRFRLAHRTHLGGELPDFLLVRALDDDEALGADLDRDPVGWSLLDGVRV